MAGAELRLLGGFELRVHSHLVELQPALQRLLAFVALSPRGVERSFTAFQLWPEKREERAKANLRSALWRLGKLPATVVSVSKTRLRLAQDVWVDTHDGLDTAHNVTDSAIRDSVMPFHTLHADLLPDWYDDWLLIERERLRQLNLTALESRARQSLIDMETSDAIHIALAAVAIDPLRESAHRIVIEAHLAEGNDSEAWRELERYRELLGCDPRLTPSSAMLALFEPTGDKPYSALATSQGQTAPVG